MAKWILKENDANIELMSKTLNISETTAYILANRDIRSKNTAIKYLNPLTTFFYDMAQMKDIDKAIDIILQSRANNEKIIVYGDYDVDGVMSTTILVKGLRKIGCDVDFHIPHREIDGYGLNRNTVIELKEAEADLIITCDNGITSLEEINIAKYLNMKVIVIDHHEPGFVQTQNSDKVDVIPMADAVIDPKQQSCSYPFESMCAAGICYKFIRQLHDKCNLNFDEDHELIIFAMIATFCDVVDLIDENRIITKNGLFFINNEPIKNLGLISILKEKNIYGKKIDFFEVGFILGPCINAAGRLKRATLAVELFLTDEDEVATSLSKQLSDLNEERKSMTTKSVEQAVYKLMQNPDNISSVIIIYDKNIHESIAGIVAGRIKDIFYHPTIVLTEGKDFVKGSARSIEGYNIFENLYANRDLFERFGGHSMAAGLSIKEENISVLQKRLNDLCELSEDDFSEIIYIDKELQISEVTFALISELDILSPFGKGNHEPLFMTENVLVKDIRVIENKNTLIFTLAIDNTYKKMKAICFGKMEYFRRSLKNLYDENTYDKIMNSNIINDFKISIVYSVAINEYMNNVSLQLRIKDFILL